MCVCACVGKRGYTYQVVCVDESSLSGILVLSSLPDKKGRKKFLCVHFQIISRKFLMYPIRKIHTVKMCVCTHEKWNVSLFEHLPHSTCFTYTCLGAFPCLPTPLNRNWIQRDFLHYDWITGHPADYRALWDTKSFYWTPFLFIRYVVVERFCLILCRILSLQGAKFMPLFRQRR